MKRINGLFVFICAFCTFNAYGAQNLSVTLDWFINPDHAPLLLAQHLGLFQKQGLTITIIPPADPNSPPKFVAAGKTDIAISYQPQLTLFAAKNMPLVRIATLIATPLTCLVVLKESGIQNLSQLKGKKIGYSVGGFDDIFLNTMLSSANLSVKDVQKVAVNFALSSSLVSKKVHAIIGAFRNFELNQLTLLNQPGVPFFPEEYGVPPYDELIFIVHTDRLSDPLLKTFVTVLEDAVQWLVNYPEKTWDILITAYPELNTPLNTKAYHDTIRRFALRPAALSHARYQQFAQFLFNNNLIQHLPPLSQYARDITNQ